MRNVKRGEKPASLKTYYVKWTNELLDEIARCEITGEKVDEKYYNRYKTKSVKDSLSKMYNNYCCYCETKVGVASFAHIEHRKPKRQNNGIPLTPFPELTYEWKNLHLACSQCNNSKGTQYDYTNPILDAVSDVNIQIHFKYEALVGGVHWYPETARAETTEKHTKLNRNKLTEARQSVWIDITNIIINLKGHPNNPAKAIVLKELKKRTEGQYGTLVKYLIDKLLN